MIQFITLSLLLKNGMFRSLRQAATKSKLFAFQMKWLSSQSYSSEIA